MVANHRNGGCDPTELELTVQPANTARPVEATPAVIITPSRIWAACSLIAWRCHEQPSKTFEGSEQVLEGNASSKLGTVEPVHRYDLPPTEGRASCVCGGGPGFFW